MGSCEGQGVVWGMLQQLRGICRGEWSAVQVLRECCRCEEGVAAEVLLGGGCKRCLVHWGLVWYHVWEDFREGWGLLCGFEGVRGERGASKVL